MKPVVHRRTCRSSSVRGLRLWIVAAIVLATLITPALICLTHGTDPRPAPTAHHLSTAASEDRAQPPVLSHDHVGRSIPQMLCHLGDGVSTELSAAGAPRLLWLTTVLFAFAAITAAPTRAFVRGPPRQPWPLPQRGARTVLSHLCVNRR